MNKVSKAGAGVVPELNWSKPYMGITHADHPTMRRFATVDTREGFSEGSCYSWDSHSHYAHGTIHGSNHENRAKRAAENAI